MNSLICAIQFKKIFFHHFLMKKFFLSGSEVKPDDSNLENYPKGKTVFLLFFCNEKCNLILVLDIKHRFEARTFFLQGNSTNQHALLLPTDVSPFCTSAIKN